jgi:5-methyltetrahydropteroyltriglutamate--homocysteine methyltransferase
MLEHFKFVKANTRVTPKISIPGPSAIHFRVADDDIHVADYKHDAEAYFDAITRTYSKAVKAFYAAGCRYLQMDDIFFAYLCDPKIREARKANGEDPDWLIGRYAKMMHDAIADRPADMLIGMHMCRGNFKSTWVADLKRKFEAASRYADIDQLGIAPQCGFASTEEGNAITEDGQKRKLELVVKTAETIWGGV